MYVCIYIYTVYMLADISLNIYIHTCRYKLDFSTSILAFSESYGILLKPLALSNAQGLGKNHNQELGAWNFSTKRSPGWMDSQGRH